METASFLSGSDNLFKYLFTVGAVMMVLSILYPLQKSQEIELLQSDLLKEAELLNWEIKELNNKYKEDKEEYRKVIFSLDSLHNSLGEKVIEGENFLKLRQRGNEIVNTLDKKKRELQIKSIVVKRDKVKTDLLKKHSESYLPYYKMIKGLGLFFVFLGFTGWCISTYIKEKSNWIALQEKKHPKIAEERIEEADISISDRKGTDTSSIE